MFKYTYIFRGVVDLRRAGGKIDHPEL